MDLLYPLAGFAVGLLVGLTGIGGGALMTPVLVLFFGVATKTAIGTDLLFAAITKSIGATVHGVRGSIDWQVFHRLVLGSLPAAAFTGAALFLLGRESLRLDHVLSQTLGGMLVLTAAGMLLKEPLHTVGRRLRLAQAERFKRWQAPATVAAGTLLGVVVTLTSVGAGAFGAVLLLYLYPLRLTPAKLVGTDLLHAIPLALVAGAGHWAMGSVDWQLLGGLLLGSLPGVLLGSWWSSRAPDQWLRPLVALALAVSGFKILTV